jgi:hypothetical protein
VGVWLTFVPTRRSLLILIGCAAAAVEAKSSLATVLERRKYAAKKKAKERLHFCWHADSLGRKFMTESTVY